MEQAQMILPAQALEDALKCNICMDTFVRPCSLPCQHTFCHDCLSMYIRKNQRFRKTKKIVCPVCKQAAPVPRPTADVKEWADQFKPQQLVQHLMDNRVPVIDVAASDEPPTPNTAKDLPHHVKKTATKTRAECQTPKQADGSDSDSGSSKTSFKSEIKGKSPIKKSFDVTHPDDKGKAGRDPIKKSFDVTHPDDKGKAGRDPIKKSFDVTHPDDKGKAGRDPIKKSFDVTHPDDKGKAGRDPIKKSFDVTHPDDKGKAGRDVQATVKEEMPDETKKEDTILHIACMKGDIDMAKHILSLNTIHIDSRGKSNKTPLINAAIIDNTELFHFLVKSGCDLLAVSEKNNNCLHFACISASMKVVQYILECNIIDIESRGMSGRTPLMLSVEMGHIELFNFLLKKGSNLLAVDDDNANVLHVACIGGSVEMVQRILALHSIDIESKGSDEMTPLMYAVLYGNVQLFDFLVKQRCNVTAMNKKQRNILHIACVEGKVTFVEHMLSLNIIDSESRGETSWTAIMYAAALGNVEILDALVKKGCNVHAVDEKNDNILHIACAYGKAKMVEHILARNIVDIESKGRHGMTPLMLTVLFSEMGLFDYIVGKGCNVSAVDEENRNILHIACIQGRVEFVQHILSLNVIETESRGKGKKTPLMYAVTNGHLQLFDFLVSKGCDLGVVDSNNDTILHLACLQNNVEMVKHIASIKTLFRESRGQFKRTPLLYAAEKGNVEIFDVLVKLGCDIRAVDEDNKNILHLACMGGQTEMVKHLLKMPCAADMRKEKTNNGTTPVELAVIKGFTQIVTYLK